MNKKLRRLLGREHRSESEKASKKKRSKRPLPSLLSQRPTATENYYCRSGNGQQEDSHFNKECDFDLKKGDLIVNTEDIDVPDNAEAVIKVTLEPIKNNDVKVETLRIVDAPIEQEIKTKQLNPICDKQVDQQSVSKTNPSLKKETSPPVMKQVLNFDETNKMGASSKSALHNASPQASRVEHDFESPNQTHHRNIEISYSNTNCIEESSIRHANVKHSVEVSCHGISQHHHENNFDLHPEVSCTKGQSFPCAFLQEHDGSFSQGVMQTNCHLRLDSTVRLEKCQHQQSTKRWSRSDARSKCTADTVKDCDWGWVSTNNDHSANPTSHRECQKTPQTCHPNASSSHSSCHRSLFKPLSSSACHPCCHGNTTPRHLMSESGIHKSCSCFSREHCNSHVTSPASCCVATECPILKKHSSPMVHACGHGASFFQPSAQGEIRPSISFLVRTDKNSSVVHEIPCLSQEENQFCEDQLAQQCSSGHCHGSERFGSTMDWEPHALRAWERHLAATNYSTTSRDSYECQKQCCHKFDSSCQFHLEKTAMAPCLTFVSDVEEIQGHKMFTNQTGCCRRAAVIGSNNSFWRNNLARATNNTYTSNALVVPSSDRVFSSPKPLSQFQLSSKAYAKLVAYCRSKNILRGLPYGNNTYPNHCNGHMLFDPFGNPVQASSTWNECPQLGRNHKSHAVYQNQAAVDLCRLARVFETVEECPWYWGELSGQEAKRLLHGSPVGTFLLRDSSDQSFLFSLSLMTKQGPTSIRIVYTNGIFRFDSDGDERTNARRRFSAPNSNREPEDYRRCVVHMILRYTKYLIKKEEAEKEDQTNLNSTSHVPSHTDPASFSQGISRSAALSCDQTTQQTLDTSKETKRERGQFMCSWMGRCGRREIQVSLTHPLLKRKTRTLQELSRITISKKLCLWNNEEKIEELPLPFSLKKFIKKYPYPV